jgi:hypothetical protein
MLKRYKTFIKESQTHSEINSICKHYGIENYSINEDGLVDVDGDVCIVRNNWGKFLIPFGHVTGDFRCSENQLTSLDGSPHKVGGDFHCYHNNIYSLIGGPTSVGGEYKAFDNNIRSFKGFPENHRSLMYIDFKTNPVNQLLAYFTSVDYLKVIHLMNEWGVIDDRVMELSYGDMCEVFDELEDEEIPARENYLLSYYTVVD